MKIWRNIFLTPSAIAALTLRFIDSLISIFVTAALLRIAEDTFVEENSIKIGIIFLFFLLVMQCVTGVFSAWLDSRWSLESINRFQLLTARKLNDRTDLHRDGTKQRRNSTGLSGASVETIDGICQYSSEYFFMAMVTLGTTIVFGLHFGTKVSTGIFVGLLLSFIFVMLSSRKVAKFAEKRTRSRWSLGEHMQLGWAAMTSADAVTKKIWKRSLKRYFSIYSDVIQGQALYVTGIQSIIRIACIIAPTVPVAIIALNDIGGPAGTAALVALPRLIAASDQFAQIVSMTVAIPEMHGRWRSLCRFLPADNGADTMTPLVSLANDNSCTLFLIKEDGATTPVSSSTLPKLGRFRITGPNGSGKTTFLLRIKNESGVDAALFTNETVSILTARKQHGSSGENKIRALNRFLLNRAESIILLDEWESRLDEATRKHMDIMIDELGKTKLIIEARHIS